MFQALKNRLIQKTQANAEKHPNLVEIFERDPIAKETQWTPAAPGGASFKTRKLTQPHKNRIVFEVTGMSKFFGLIFMGAGLLTCSMSIVVQEAWFFFLPFGGVFVLVGFFVFKMMTQPSTFDQTLGYFWKGKDEPRTGKESVVTQLDQIHALQLIAERLTSSSSSSSSRSVYHSFELNLVLRTGERVNVIDHGDLHQIRKDANILGDFLGVEVWDAT